MNRCALVKKEKSAICDCAKYSKKSVPAMSRFVRCSLLTWNLSETLNRTR